MEYKMVNFEDLLIDSTRNGISKPKAIRGEGVPMINMGELFRYDRIPNLRDLELVPLTDPEKGKFLLKENDLLFARRSLTLEGAGKCSIYLSQTEATFESSIIRARIDQEKANPKFYYYYFSSRMGKALISSIAEQVAVSGIRGSDLKKLKVHYINKIDQDKISSFFDSMDSKIELNKQIISNLEQLAQSLFKRWFVDFEFPNENGEPYQSSGGKTVESKLGMIPEGWEVGSLSDVATLIMGQSPKSDTYNIIGEGLPLINGASDFKGGLINPLKYTTNPKKVSKQGDFVFGVRATVGNVTNVDKEYALGRGVGIARTEKLVYKEF